MIVAATMVLGWVAVAFTLCALYLMAHKRVAGWAVQIVGCVLWVLHSSCLGDWPVVTINAVIGVFSCYGLYVWRRK